MENIIKELKGKSTIKLLFICSGNIIRSVMAQFLFKKYIESEIDSVDKFEINSGAVLFKNDAIDEKTKKILLNEGIKKGLDEFKPTYLKSKENMHYLEEADAIIAMEASHIRMIPKKFRSKAFLLTDLSKTPKKLPDPFGADIKPYIESFQKIKPLIIQLIDVFKKYDIIT
ncbi:MAG: low molecular weight phosphatase family protein [Promethearchaeota archaeon]|nr:MAG: low molecular weight phosphatase family protein [Candidatus Lokiarchaeota archaeon]